MNMKTIIVLTFLFSGVTLVALIYASIKIAEVQSDVETVTDPVGRLLGTISGSRGTDNE